MYADFIEQVDNFTLNDWLFFLGFTFFITVVLMNLLIAIIGETFLKVQEDTLKSQNAQLCEIVLEFEVFMFWKRIKFLGGGEYVEPLHLVYAEY